MNATEVHELFAYNRWANGRLLDASAALDAEQFTRDMRSSFPSIRDTFVHILQAEWIWLCRWQGVSPTDAPEGWDEAEYPELRKLWTEHEREQTAWLESLHDATLNEPLAYVNFKGEPHRVRLDHLVRHVINHSSYHRGQVTTMLRQLGIAPPATDLVLFHTSGAPVVT
jgi:uncharacterized damage-inducible protein DinB